MGSKGQDSTLSEHRDPPSTLGMGSGQNSAFTEHHQVMLYMKLKENQDCSNMLANILPADLTYPHPPDPGDGVSRLKFTFLEHGHVAYQI